MNNLISLIKGKTPSALVKELNDEMSDTRINKDNVNDLCLASILQSRNDKLVTCERFEWLKVAREAILILKAEIRPFTNVDATEFSYMSAKTNLLKTLGDNAREKEQLFLELNDWCVDALNNTKSERGKIKNASDWTKMSLESIESLRILKNRLNLLDVFSEEEKVIFEPAIAEWISKKHLLP